jgi:tight adherence protein C
MIIVLSLTALLIFPAAFLIVIGDEIDPLEQAQKIARSQARKSRDRSQLRLRLEEVGRGNQNEYEIFRIRQYGYSAGTVAIGLVVFTLISQSSSFVIPASVFLGALMFVAIDKELSKSVKKRREMIEAEFPAIIEMLTLAIAAGETPMSAMLRIANSSDSHLAKEFQIVVAEVRTGVPLNVTLDAMGRRVKSVMIRRFVDALVTATLRGAPIVEVLSRHAVEARGNQRNRIMAAAGKAEISMMIPVVFLILPISIMFALWPSLTNLNMFAS